MKTLVLMAVVIAAACGGVLESPPGSHVAEIPTTVTQAGGEFPAIVDRDDYMCTRVNPPQKASWGEDAYHCNDGARAALLLGDDFVEIGSYPENGFSVASRGELAVYVRTDDPRTVHFVTRDGARWSFGLAFESGGPLIDADGRIWLTAADGYWVTDTEGSRFGWVDTDGYSVWDAGEGFIQVLRVSDGEAHIYDLDRKIKW